VEITFSNSAGPLHAAGICANKIVLNACTTQAQQAIRAHRHILTNLIVCFPLALHCTSHGLSSPVLTGGFAR
jgi:hypothetical protein